MSSNQFIPQGTTYYKGLFDDSAGLTIQKADLRYVRIGSNATLNALFASGIQANTLTVNGQINCSSLLINGTPLDLSTISGVVNGVAQANKALIVDSSRNISNINALSCVSLTLNGAAVDLSTISGITLGTPQANKALTLNSSGFLAGSLTSSILNDAAVLAIYQRWINPIATPIEVRMNLSNVAPQFGTFSNHNFRLMTNGANRLHIAAGGNVGINTSNPQYTLDVNGSINISALSDYFVNGASLSSVLQAANDQRYVGINLNGSDGFMFGARTIQHISDQNLTLRTNTSSSSSSLVFQNDNRRVHIGLRGSTNATNPNSLTIFDETANAIRLIMDTSGNFNVGGSINCSGLLINGIPVSATNAFLDGVVAGVSSPSKAMVLDANREINNVGGITFQNAIVGNQRLIARDVSFLRNIDTEGIAEPLKCMVLDATRSINNINTMEMGTAILDGSTGLIGSVSVSGRLFFSGTGRGWGWREVSADSLSVLSLSSGGSYISALTYTHTTTPTWEYANGANLILNSGSSTNTYTTHLSVGNLQTKGRFILQTFYQGSNNDGNHIWLRNSANEEQGLVLRADGRVVVNGQATGGSYIANPLGILHVRGGITTTLDMPRAFMNTSGVSTTSGTNSVPIGIYSNAWIQSLNGFTATSDKRVKSDIESISLDEAKKLLNVKPITYRMNGIDKDRQAGIIAQDLCKVGLMELIGFVQNEELEEEEDDDGFISPSKVQLVAKYDRITVYLLRIIQDQEQRISELEDKMNSFI